MKHLLLCLLIAVAAPLAVAQDNQTTPPTGDAKPVAAANADAKADAKTADLPVSRVVLFSSGVGYIEHIGTVEGDAVVKLMFETEQINDVLKSMIVADANGQVASVKYASRDPLARALKSFAIDLANDPNMAAILKQLRGAQVIVRAPEEVRGRVVGVEVRKKQILEGGQSVIIEEPVLNLLTAGGLKSIPTHNIAAIELVDEKLQAELTQALELLATSSDKERKAVEVHFRGEGKRQVRIGYVVETPVWKVSYRLDLDDAESLLQGWAIVENTSDSDWKDVELSLVSGRPISFIQDLYTPLYMPRPVVQPKLYASLTPRLYEEGLYTSDLDDRVEKASESLVRGGSGRVNGRFDGKALNELRTEDDGRYSYQPPIGREAFKALDPAAVGGRLGELFRFTIKTPVTLGRRRSAMLPIVNSPIKVEKLSIFNASQLAQHPLNGAWITNSTDLKLMGGPATVYAENAYAGDTVIDNMVPDEKRLISYAVDLEVAVDTSNKTDSRITQVSINQGALRVTRLHRYTQTYAFKNKAKAAKELLVEHPFTANRKLVAPEKFVEKTDQYYRFRVTAPAGETAELAVVEELTQLEAIGLLDANWTQLVWYVQNAQMSDAVKEELTKAVRMKQEILELQRQLGQLEQELRQITSGQDRLRKNIETVGRDSQLGQRYLKKLSAEEDRIEQLDKDIASLRKQIEDKQQALREYVNGLQAK